MKLLQLNNNLALAYKDQNYTYQDLLQQAGAYRQLLDAYQPKKVMIYSENRPEWVFAFYGAWMKLATVVPTDVMSTAPELNYMISDCEPDVIFCSAEKKPVVVSAIQSVAKPLQVLVFEDLKDLALPLEASEVEIADIQKTAVIIYTSGTTGSPKGVMLSFENIFANVKSVSKDIPIFQSHETVMILLPLHHVFPLVGSMIAPLFVGGKTAMSPSLNTEDILKTLQQHKVSIIIGVPRLYTLIRKNNVFVGREIKIEGIC